MDKIYKVALVGCGTIAPNHLRALKSIPYVKIVALCDLNFEKAESRKNEYELDCNVYTDFDVMLDSEELDSLHVATPHYLHAPMTLKALKKGINVFLEKPMCISKDEIEELIKAESESNAKVCVCFQNRFNPSTVLAERIANEDGGVKSAFGSVFWFRDEKYYTNSGWRGEFATEGGGVMINQAIHTLDLLCYYLGKPDSVMATVTNHHLKDVIEVEDSAEGIIKFENGKKANFYMTTSFEGRDATILYLVTEKKRRIQIQYSAVYVDGEKIEDPSLISDFIGKECYGNGHMYLIANYYDALKCGKEMPVTLESAQYALRVLLASYRSNNQETKI
ncbi:MAG: Gfo/Idh/MocA family oxidoreductase [Ruminococcaceae bacterium]|nr:Gfo/Idh/MocA family oxidoreductase [Oscillospiraceae bacterium]